MEAAACRRGPVALSVAALEETALAVAGPAEPRLEMVVSGPASVRAARSAEAAPSARAAEVARSARAAPWVRAGPSRVRALRRVGSHGDPLADLAQIREEAGALKSADAPFALLARIALQKV